MGEMKEMSMFKQYLTSRNVVRAGAVGVTLAALAGAAPTLAHHAFGAEFYPNRPLGLRGPVTRVEWVNPHTWIHMEVTTEDGSKETWMVEGGTPNTLLRNGLTRESLTPGTEIVVDGYACTLAEEFTRDGLVDAMRKRHSYGATDNIIGGNQWRPCGGPAHEAVDCHSGVQRRGSHRRYH